MTGRSVSFGPGSLISSDRKSGLGKGLTLGRLVYDLYSRFDMT